MHTELGPSPNADHRLPQTRWEPRRRKHSSFQCSCKRVRTGPRELYSSSGHIFMFGHFSIGCVPTCLVPGPPKYLLAARTANHTIALFQQARLCIGMPLSSRATLGGDFLGSGEGRHGALCRCTYFCFGLLGQHEGKAARLEQWERPPMPDSS